MPYRRKDSPIWWASYTDANGKRVRRSTATTERKEADALEAKWKLEAFRQNQWGEQPSRSFDELMLAYLKATAGEKRSHDRDLYSVKNLRKVFRGRDLGTVMAADVNHYITQRREAGVAPATINREIGLLSSALNWARRELDWNIPNSIQGRKLKVSDARVRWITREEASVLLNAAKDGPKTEHLFDFIRFALNTGMRRGEILGLEWRRVDLKENLVYLGAQHQKNAKLGSVPLNGNARAALLSRVSFRAKHCPGSHWVFAHKNGDRIGSVRKGFTSTCERAGIDDFRVHDLRHTCAAWLVQSGVSLREVAELLRHSDIRITMRYAHLAPENVRAAVTLLEGSESRSGHVGSRSIQHKGDKPTAID